MSEFLSTATVRPRSIISRQPIAGSASTADDMVSGASIGNGTTMDRPPTPGGATSSIDSPGNTQPGRGPQGSTSLAFKEVAGDTISTPAPVPRGQPPEASAEAHVEVGTDATEAGEEFAEATTEQMRAVTSGAEAGEESAFSDLRELSGFMPPAFSETAISLRDSSTATDVSRQEFFPLLAALVPTLISTVGPLVAKAISSRLSPRATAIIQRVAAQPAPQPRPNGAPPTAAGTSLASLLPILARLLQTAAAKAGGESAGEGAEAIDESLVESSVAVIETILFNDDRLSITNTMDIPWRRYCALRISFPSGATYRGTGFFIGPNAVVTAGHCVYLRTQGGWARSIEVIPGCNGSKRPFGQAVATIFRSVSGWVSSGLPECDYGCIFLPRGSFGGANLGYFGAAAFDAATLVAQPAVVAGYHGDKPFAELWGMPDVIKTVSAKTIAYPHDTAAGCSGAPVYVKRDGVRYVVGIHNYGGTTSNSATRITEPVYQRLQEWSKM